MPAVESTRRDGAWVSSSASTLRDGRWIAGGAAVAVGTVAPGVTVQTKFGACPAPGATLADVVAKYGPKTFLRSFLGQPGTSPTKTSGASGTHYSWSFGVSMDDGSAAANSAILQAITNGDRDTDIQTAVATLDPTYATVECIHEGDTKYSSGQVDVAELVAAKNRFYQVVKGVKPTLKIVNTLQGFSFSNNSTSPYPGGLTESRWGGVKADLIGLDVDGIHRYPYPVMDDRAVNAQKWVRDHPTYTGWCCPEWGTSRVPTTTSDNSPDLPDLVEYAAWITKYGGWKTQPLPPEYMCWFDYPYNPEKPSSLANNQLEPGSNPYIALSNLIAASTATVAA